MAKAHWKIKRFTQEGILYIKFTGDLDADDGVKSAKDCSKAIGSDGPWIVLADLTELDSFHHSGAAAWKTAFNTNVVRNMRSLHVAMESRFVSMATTVWATAIRLKIETYRSWKQLTNEFQMRRIRLPEELLRVRSVRPSSNTP